MAKWLQSFEVPSTSGRGTYIVSLDKTGNWGCSCPHWKFRRSLWKHIQDVQARVQQTRLRDERVIPVCRAANVPEVTRERDDVLLVPLVPLDDEHFLATVIVDLLMYGVPFFEIRQRYHLPPNTRRDEYIRLVTERGRRIYAPSGPPASRRSCVTTQNWNLPVPPLPGETTAAYSDRTGCLDELAQIAFEQLQTQPSPFPQNPCSTADIRPAHREAAYPLLDLTPGILEPA